MPTASDLHWPAVLCQRPSATLLLLKGKERFTRCDLIAAAGLGLVPAPSASAAATGGRPAIAYVLNQAGYVTPINIKTDVAWKPIQVGSDARAEATTPNGRTLYSYREPGEGLGQASGQVPSDTLTTRPHGPHGLLWQAAYQVGAGDPIAAATWLNQWLPAAIRQCIGEHCPGHRPPPSAVVP